MILPEAAVPTSSPTVHRTPRPNHVPGPRVGVLRGSAATVLCGALGLALGATAARTTASSTGPIGLDVLVAALALGLGAAAAVVLAVGCGLLTVAALGRALGRSLDGLDALAARLTPALLRRAVAVTVSTGLGLAAATGVASASEPDLGWQVTTSSSASGTDAAPGGAAGPGRPAAGGHRGDPVGPPPGQHCHRARRRQPVADRGGAPSRRQQRRRCGLRLAPLVRGQPRCGRSGSRADPSGTGAHRPRCRGVRMSAAALAGPGPGGQTRARPAASGQQTSARARPPRMLLPPCTEPDPRAPAASQVAVPQVRSVLSPLTDGAWPVASRRVGGDPKTELPDPTRLCGAVVLAAVEALCSARPLPARRRRTGGWDRAARSS